MEGFVTKSITIAIVKKNILDILLKTLKNEGFVINEQLLIEQINGIELATFEELENYKSNRFRYSRKVEQIVTSILKQYLEVI